MKAIKYRHTRAFHKYGWVLKKTNEIKAKPIIIVSMSFLNSGDQSKLEILPTSEYK